MNAETSLVAEDIGEDGTQTAVPERRKRLRRLLMLAAPAVAPHRNG